MTGWQYVGRQADGRIDRLAIVGRQADGRIDRLAIVGR